MPDLGPTLLDPSLARWITAPGEDPQNPLLRLRFGLGSPPVSARLLVTGLGTFRAHVNGDPVSSSRLDPGLTDPRRRVQVCEAEISPLLLRGENVLAIELGRGFHAMTSPNVWRWHEAPWRGPVRAWARLRLELADGTTRALTTGADWRTRPGPVTFDSMYEGETFSPTEDPTAWLLPGYDDADWAPVLVARPGGGARRRAPVPEPLMQLQGQEPVVERAEITPSVVSSSPERIVLDMGRVIAGWCRYDLLPDGATGAAGAGAPVEFVARHGEKLRADGSVDDANEHVPTGRFQQDRIRLDPRLARSFAPRHSYKGFRYVQLDPVSGSLSSLAVTGILAHADLREVSELRSSDTFLERFDAAMRASLLNNMHHVPTDTPMHEKNGWTGDALTALAAMTASFDMRRMLRKWLDDQVDGQREDGSLSVIAPNPGWGYEELSPAPEWTCLLPTLLDELATEYAMIAPVREHGGAAARYLDHELGRRDGDGLVPGVLGDYLTPGSPGPAPEDRRLTGSLFVARALRSLAHAVDLATCADGAACADPWTSSGERVEGVPAPEALRGEAAALERAVNTVFLDRARGVYRDPGTIGEPGSASYRQTSNLLPLAAGIVPPAQVEAVVGNLVADIGARGDHHDCGHIGVRFLLPVLSAHGHGALAWRVLTAPDAPGWKAWLEAGNSTFMEMWEDPRSCSHYFMGTPVTWIHENAAGLRRGPDGWGEFLVAPDPDVPVGRISIARTTELGEIVLAVDRERRRLELEVPTGSRARVELPGIARHLPAGRHVVDW
ncbi:family 78 glycoside hydrolase catalytic domain [Brachybacterium sp. AOP43-C2-M15]|uniref:family 78 glycoside hydrolase catalytic domain n=1 Tax=Brachybacterium sp. AOP43-C2-M15 TaxID=3457661 RepID=UPI004033860D